MSARAPEVFALLLAAALAGCAELSGVADLEVTSTVATGSGGGTGAAGGSAASGGSGDCAPDPDFESDPHHCGACGRSCLGGACVAGACVPTVLHEDGAGVVGLAVTKTHLAWANLSGSRVGWSPKAPPLEPFLVDFPKSPRDVALGPNTVWWTEADTMSADLGFVALDASGAPAPLGAMGIGGRSIERDDNGDVYWVTVGLNPDDGALNRCAAGCFDAPSTAMPVSTGGFPKALALALDATHVYVTSSASGSVHRIAKSLIGSPESYETFVSFGPEIVHGIAVHAGEVYWGQFTSGSLWRAPTSDGVAAHQIAGSYPGLAAVVADEQNVYFSYYGSSQTCNAEEPATGGVVRWPRRGGEPVEIAGPQKCPYSIALDDEYVYVASSATGVISRVAK